MEGRIRIAVCDDERIFAEKAEQLCEEWFSENDIPCWIDVFTDSVELLLADDSYDIYVLDIEMQTLNGYRLASELQKKNSRGTYIFLTGHGEMMGEAFRINAFRFLLKPCRKEELEEALSSAVRTLRETEIHVVDNQLGSQIPISAEQLRS